MPALGDAAPVSSSSVLGAGSSTLISWLPAAGRPKAAPPPACPRAGGSDGRPPKRRGPAGRAGRGSARGPHGSGSGAADAVLAGREDFVGVEGALDLAAHRLKHRIQP